MSYLGKKELVSRLHKRLEQNGFQVPGRIIDQVFTGRRGSYAASHRLFAVWQSHDLRRTVAELKRRGVIFEGKKAIGIKIEGVLAKTTKTGSNPQKVSQSPKRQPEDDELAVFCEPVGCDPQPLCPDCGAFDPQWSQAGHCPHCGAILI